MHREIETKWLAPGMVFARDVIGNSGRVILFKGAVATEDIIRHLLAWDIEKVIIRCSEMDGND